MKFHSYTIFISLLAFAIVTSSCDSSTSKQSKKTKNKEEFKQVNVPLFNADSAYKYVAEQVAFGPRVPNTKEHEAAASYLKKR